MKRNKVNTLGFRLTIAVLGICLLTMISMLWAAFMMGQTVLEQFPGALSIIEYVVLNRLDPEQIAQLTPAHLLPARLARGLLWIAMFNGIIGSTVGYMISRRMTAPLNELATAARAIGGRDFSRRVELGGTDEIVEVAGAFNQMAEELESAEGKRQQLLSDIAHELRTPITVIQGNLRAILDDIYPLEKEEVARLYDQTLQLTRLVNDLRELSQADADRLTLNMQSVHINDVVQDATERFEPLAEGAGIQLVTYAGVDLPAVSADPMRMLQVLDNLLANALRHTPAGGAIQVRTRGDKDTVTLEVIDSGEGIAADDLPHLFDRFYRTDRSRNRDTGGSGLGLAITRSLVEAQGGSVLAHSAGLGHGSTFVVQIPISPDAR